MIIGDVSRCSFSCTVVKKRFVRKVWARGEIDAVRASLGSYFHLNRLPGKSEILKTCQHHPALQQRSWQNIKDFMCTVLYGFSPQ